MLNSDMHKIALFLVVATLSPLLLQAQIAENISLWSSWHDNSLPSSGGLVYNDLWGYVDGSGNEYAILGSLQKVHFIDVSNPSSPVEVATIIPGASSIWRDFKTYGNYAYGVADQGSEGLLVMDLSNLPASASLVRQVNDFNRAHNIFIDVSNGRLYAAGSDTRNKGLWIYDIASDPSEPKLLGSPTLNNYGGPTDSYVHDLYVEDNIAYCSHGYSGFYYYNILNPELPYAINGDNTNGYNHSSWMIPGGQYIVYAQEVPKGMPMVIIDLDDDMSTVASFKEPLLAPNHMDNTPHNPFVKGNLIYTSYYEDGVQVFDISNINNPVRVAYYDTEPNNTSYSGTNNNWGIYPFLPSGSIIASDTEYGLFVLQLQSSALPVEWLSVAAVPEDKGVSIQWATAAETNNDFFVVEKSLDGKQFEQIGIVPGAGNAQTVRQYNLLDKTPGKGLNYYRIKQQDFDGNAAYSDLVSAKWDECPKIENGLMLRTGQPMLIPEQLRGQAGQAVLWNTNGNRLGAYNWEAGQRSLIAVAQTLAGVYFVEYHTDCGTLGQKVVIMNE